ncbi:flowering time control protein FPA-like [Sesamum indicum]|uniref:Flowering time control protein FPA-like n=1 Tax=Sesamum indicum TaxID=4182 RepID=A0A6I9SVE0_SESIN|nr:flowering time control protein FPA-like [Sesamum indicum]
MAPPTKSAAEATQNNDAAIKSLQREILPSNNLWIGNLSPNVTDFELKHLFAAHGEVIGINLFPPRRYAFVHFKETEGATLARHGLQGYVLHGKPLVINFAKPAKLSNILWVGGINQCVSKEELQKEFVKFGQIKKFRYLRDQHIAYIYYMSVEEAAEALKSMNGKPISGDKIHVDFLKSQSPRESEQGAGPREGQLRQRNLVPSGIQWTAEHSLTNYPDSSLAGAKNQNQSLHIGSQEGGSQCSKVLLIRYPPPLVIEKHMLHGALSQTEEEASCARECLQGKLFNDPRISIEFSSSEPGRRARLSECPYPPVQTDMLDLDRPVLASFGPHRPDVVTRPITAPRVTFGPVVPGPGHQTPAGDPNLRRLSSAPGMISFSSPGFSIPDKRVSGAWDGFHSNELHRESKRSRFDAPLSAEIMKTEGENYLTTLSVTTGAVGHHSDCIWRGIVAKGGLPVCRARCVAIGERIDTHLPNVVNCSGRIRLDVLSKKYASAIGFNLLLFLPDGEEDFASYTEFLSYLIAKDRAGVAKLDDGTMLFLVPPSNFLSKVLDASAPLRLHGLVLKFSEPASNSRSMSALPIQPQYGDTHKETYLQTGYNVVYPEQRPLPVTYSGVLPKVSISPPEAPRLLSSSLQGHSVAPPDVNIFGGEAIDHHGTDASKFASSSNIQQEACRVPLANQSNVNDVSKPLPSEVECKHQNQQFQTAVNREVHERTETEAEKNERYRKLLSFAANLLSRVRQQRDSPPENGTRVDESAPSSGN